MSAINTLAAALDKLPQSERLVLSLYYDEALNFAEIAAGLSITEEEARMTYELALSRIKGLICPPHS